MSDLLLRRVFASRAGAQGPDDYDFIGGDGTGAVHRAIFRTTTSPVGTPWIWNLAYDQHEDHTPTHGYEGNAGGCYASIRQELAQRGVMSNEGAPKRGHQSDGVSDSNADLVLPRLNGVFSSLIEPDHTCLRASHSARQFS